VLLVLAAAVAPFAAFAVPELAGAEESYVVLSGSMEPTIDPGDVVLVEERAPATIGPGDVITYRRSGAEKPTTHRVVEVTEVDGQRAFVTKGDANEDPDPQPVAGEHVVGTVAVRLPNVGHVVQFANTALGRVVFVLLPFLFLGLSEIQLLVSKLREGDDDPDDDPEEERPSPLPAGEPGAVEYPSVTARAATATTAPPGTAADEQDDDTLIVDPTDLTATSALLLLGAGYTVYTAIRLQTQLTITAAFGSVFLLIAVGSLRVAADRSGASPPARRAVDARRVPALPVDGDWAAAIQESAEITVDDWSAEFDEPEEIRFADDPTSAGEHAPDWARRAATDGGRPEVERR